MTRTKLLLVDDEEDFISALSERLRLRNFETNVAQSGAEALVEIERERPDIVLLDLKMPGMDGMEALEKIKGLDASIEVIMVTGSVDRAIGEAALKAGASGHIIKPIDIDDLLAKVRELEKAHGLG